MQTSKFLLAMGALAVVVLPLQVQAGPDTAEQAKMREVLRRMMQESTTPPPAATTVASPAAPAPPKPVVITAPQSVPQPVAAPTTPAAPPPPAAPVKTEVVTVAAPTSPAFDPVPPPDDAASVARARETLRQKMQELQATPASTVATTPIAPAPVGTPAPGSSVAVVTPKGKATPVFAPTYAPIQAPDSPLSGAKQTKLAELLARYKADAITAQEYHAERAAILAGP